MKTHYVLTLHPNFTTASKGGLLVLQSKICLITFSDILFIVKRQCNKVLKYILSL